MLEKVFGPSVVMRLRLALGKAGDGLAAELAARGYSTTTIQSRLRGAGHFGKWLKDEGIPLGKVTDDVAARFLMTHVPTCRCAIPKGAELQSAVAHLVAYLRTTHQIAPVPVSPRTHIGDVLERFNCDLRDVRGLKPSSRKSYLQFAREFLEYRFGVGPVQMGRLHSRDLVDFIEKKAEGRTSSTIKLVGTALNSLMRFSRMRGLCDLKLAYAVPTRPSWRLSRLPASISDEQLKLLLTSCNRLTAIGRRDHAILLCLIDLGLRAGEAARLSLDDVDWRGGTLRIPLAKGRHGNVLPLPTRVGRAIVSYLRRGRPASPSRFIFLRHVTPRDQPITTDCVRALVERAFTRAGIVGISKGTHTLRHTAATRMLRAGASLKELADILGHSSLDTTSIYAKVDLPTLAEVALPWPVVIR